MWNHFLNLDLNFFELENRKQSIKKKDFDPSYFISNNYINFGKGYSQAKECRHSKTNEKYSLQLALLDHL